MRLTTYLFSALTFALSFVAGCGTTIRPHVREGVGDPPPTLFPGGRLNPRPDADRSVPDESKPLVDQICRVHAMRSGWIATRYIVGEGDCPASTDPANPYTMAVIERYTHKQVGTVMTVCADQPIPRQWIRASDREASGNCQGARVREGAPTVMAIRRIG